MKKYPLDFVEFLFSATDDETMAQVQLYDRRHDDVLDCTWISLKSSPMTHIEIRARVLAFRLDLERNNVL